MVTTCMMKTVNILYISNESTFKHCFNKSYAGKVTSLLITLAKSPGRKRLTYHIDPNKHSVIKQSKNKLVKKYVYPWHFFWKSPKRSAFIIRNEMIILTTSYWFYELGHLLKCSKHISRCKIPIPSDVLLSPNTEE